MSNFLMIICGVMANRKRHLLMCPINLHGCMGGVRAVEVMVANDLQVTTIPEAIILFHLAMKEYNPSG